MEETLHMKHGKKLLSVLLALACAGLVLYLSRGGRRRFEAL